MTGSTMTNAKTELDAMHAAHAEAAKYRPRAEEGLLLARIYDSAARTPWQSVPDDTPENRAEGAWVTDADLARGEQHLEYLLDAFKSGDRDALDRLEEANAILRNTPRTPTELRQRYSLFIRGDVERAHLWAKAYPDDEAEQRERCGWQLSGYVKLDPAFAELTAARLHEALLTVDLSKPSGGQGNVGVDQIAAELAIECGAFGTATEADAGTAAQLDRFKQSLRDARKAERKSEPGKQTPEFIARRDRSNHSR